MNDKRYFLQLCGYKKSESLSTNQSMPVSPVTISIMTSKIIKQL